jgi:sulfate permease, SulP family
MRAATGGGKGSSRGGARRDDRRRPDTTWGPKNKISWADPAAGAVIGVSIILWSFTLAALIFKGELAPFMARGAGFILAGSIVLGLIMALRSTHPGTIAAPDEAAGVIIGLIASTIVMKSTHLDAEAMFATVMATIVVSTMMCALIFLGLGLFRLGNLVRFIPHPVIGGVVVTMGWLLVIGAFTVMTDQEFSLTNASVLLSPAVIEKWVPGVILALTLLIAMRIWRHFLILPSLFVTSIGLFYVTTSLSNLSIQQLRDGGWLLGPFANANLFTYVSSEIVVEVDWSLVINALPDIASLILLCVLGLLLSATALEVAMRGDIDLNHELKLAGTANGLAALTGGIAGSHSLEDSLIAREMGASSRMVGVVAAMVCAIALFFGAELLSFLPKPLIGGFILFFGLVLLVEWVYDGWFKLPRTDYLVVMLCLLVSLTQGYLLGIGVGLLAGIVIFVIDYSQIDVIKRAMSGTQYRSNVERHPRARDLLNRHGDRIMILKLQGFIFFGTAHKIYQRIESRNADKQLEPLSFVMLDFAAVSGTDVSTAASFSKMRQLAERGGFRIVLVNVHHDIALQFTKSGVLESHDQIMQIYADADHGLEWCEDSLLEMLGANDAQDPRETRTLAGWLADPQMVAELVPYLESRYVLQGEYLIRQGDPSSDLFFIESGRVAIQLEDRSGPPLRLRSMGAGTVVGEIAMYLELPRSASVVAEQPSRVYRLTRYALEQMRINDSALSAKFNEFMVKLLAGRLVDTNNMLRAVMD